MTQFDNTTKKVDVRRMTNLHIFKKYMRLVAGEGGLDRVVVHTTVWEAPDLATQLEGREFVLSVGYLKSINPLLARKGFEALTEKISAMGIKIGRYIERVPEEFIRIADEKNIPLFEIKPECRFKWIIQAIMAEINVYKASVLMEVDHYYQEMYDMTLSGGRDASVLSQISRYINAPCLLFSADLQTHVWPEGFSCAGERDEVLDEAIRLFSARMHPENEWHEGKWHVFTLFGGDVVLGYLVVILDGELNDTARLMIRQLRMFLTMKWLEGYKGRQDSLNRLWSRLMRTPVRDERVIREVMNSNGFSAGELFRVMILRSGSQFLEGNLRRLLAHCLVIRLGGGDCIILTDGGNEQNFPYYLAKLREILAAERGAVLSVGPSVRGIAAVRDSYRLAKNSFRVAQGRTNDHLLYYKDWLHELSLLGGAGTLETMLFVEKYLSPLIKYDREHDGHMMMDTLSAAIRSATVQAAARKLCVHANTLRYRIERITDLTGLDFFQCRDRELLSHALFCYEFGSDEAIK